METVAVNNHENRIRFHHFWIEGAEARCTVAYKLDENKNSPTREVTYAAAFCAPEDQFSKKKGRLKAAGRLTKHAKKLLVSFGEAHGFYSHVNSLLRAELMRMSPEFSTLTKQLRTLERVFEVSFEALPDVCFFSKDNVVFHKKGNVTVHAFEEDNESGVAGMLCNFKNSDMVLFAATSESMP